MQNNQEEMGKDQMLLETTQNNQQVDLFYFYFILMFYFYFEFDSILLIKHQITTVASKSFI